MKLHAKIFESTSKSWEHMCEEVSEFVASIGKERLVTISASESGGIDLGGTGSRGTLIVWYWE
jgi:hypothetical protein